MMNTVSFTSQKKKVLFRGPVLTQSGYGVHARQIAKWLLGKENIELEFQALPWGDTPWLIDANAKGGLIGSIMERTVDPSGKKYDATVQLQLPNEWDPSLGSVNIGITAGVETDRCNPQWVTACNNMHAVVVPSKHSAECLKNSGDVRAKLFVIPESYSEAIDLRAPTKIDQIKLETGFNFLIFGQITGNNPENDRKNIFYTLKWLCESFKDDKDVGVVIKTNSGRNTHIDRKVVTQTLKSVIDGVRVGPFPKIYLLHGELTDEEVSSLYRHPQIKSLVALTRGEGFGLPIMEAAASGLPVISTGWSGHMDFMSLGKSITVDYRVSPVHQSRIDGNIFVQGSRWAEPSEEDFKKKIVKFRGAPSIPREWSEDLGKKIRENYSISSIISRYESTLGGLL